jgi:hypothetical protein
MSAFTQMRGRGLRVQDRLTVEDACIYDRMPLVGRLMVKRDLECAEIMTARTLAAARGSSPVEIQRNVERYEVAS